MIERHVLGLFYTTEKYHLCRLSFSRGVSHDRGRPQSRQSFADEHVPTIHPLSAHITWISNLGLKLRHTYKKENFRGQV